MFCLEETQDNPLTLKNPRSSACPGPNEVPDTDTSQQFLFGALCCLSLSETFLRFKEYDRKQRSSGDLMLFGKAFKMVILY